MTLGIGANVTLFTVVRSVLLKPLPFRDPGRLIMLYESNPKDDRYNIVAGGMYAEWNKYNKSFNSLALVQDSENAVASSGGQLPEKLTSAGVSLEQGNADLSMISQRVFDTRRDLAFVNPGANIRPLLASRC